MEDKKEAGTFTQEDVDKIVQERLSRERAKYADYEDLKKKASAFDEAEEASKTELQKATERAAALQTELDRLTHEAEVKNVRDQVAQSTGIPVTLLTGTTEDECKAQADAIAAYAKTASYPDVKDAGTKTVSTQTRDQFADWLNEQIGG